MKATVRTILAFVVAPSIAPIILGIATTGTQPERIGPTWIAAFTENFLAAAVVSYLISYTLGLTAFFILRAVKRETVLSYSTVGTSAGILWGLLASRDSGFAETVTASGYLGLLGCSVATTFIVIRGSSKKLAKAVYGHPIDGS